MQNLFRNCLCLLAGILLAGCETTFEGDHTARAAMNSEIKNEQPGNYFIGRRFFKVDYKFWGYVRSPGQPWSTAKLVVMNEQKKLAPDRELGKLGCDNNYEYKLYGTFGETVYEPASNGFYPQFNLASYELRSLNPAPIFREAGATDPARRVIPRPY